jgi:hypothetical protein
MIVLASGGAELSPQTDKRTNPILGAVHAKSTLLAIKTHILLSLFRPASNFSMNFNATFAPHSVWDPIPQSPNLITLRLGPTVAPPTIESDKSLPFV